MNQFRQNADLTNSRPGRLERVADYGLAITIGLMLALLAVVGLST